MSKHKRKTPVKPNEPGNQKEKVRLKLGADSVNGVNAARKEFKWILCPLLFLLVVAVFIPSIRNDFVNYDDNDYVTANPHVLKGLGWEGLRWAFGSFSAGNWHPLTWISHMMDYQLFGLTPTGHHLTSVLLHGINAVLLFLLVRSLTGHTWRSLFVAAVFALHPLRVESVTWISERKDVLSTTLGFLSIWAYVQFARETACSKSSGRKFYVLALLFFVLSLMSKAMFVTLPLLLLLLDWWPLERIQKAKFANLLGEKIPFLLLSLVSSGVTYLAQKSGGAVQSTEAIPLVARLENSVLSYVRYLGKLFFPRDLSVFYPRPEHWPLVMVIGASLLVLLICIVAWVVRKKLPWVFVGWYWYVISLLPVIGLVQVGHQAMADRYTMLPSIGILLLVTWFACDLVGRHLRNRMAIPLLGTAAVLFSAVVTVRQIAHWKNSETLFRRSMAVTENNYIACLQLGDYFSDQGRSAEAVDLYRRSMAISPKLKQTHNNLGNTLLKLGQTQKAIIEFQKALELDPNFAAAHNGLGAVFKSEGKLDLAAAEFKQAIKADPDFGDAYSNLGYTLAMQGTFEEAIKHFQAALKLKPHSAEAHCDLGAAFAAAGNKEEALKHFKEALKLRPNFPDAEEQMRLLMQQAQ